MNLIEIVTIVVGAGAGYWLVSFLLGGKRSRAAPSATPSAAPSAAPTGPAPALPAAEPSWPAVLGVSVDASLEDIRSAYQRLISQYHPDKVASLGAELQEFASRKTQALNAAYAEALASRGAPA